MVDLLSDSSSSCPMLASSLGLRGAYAQPGQAASDMRRSRRFTWAVIGIHHLTRLVEASGPSPTPRRCTGALEDELKPIALRLADFV